MATNERRMRRVMGAIEAKYGIDWRDVPLTHDGETCTGRDRPDLMARLRATGQIADWFTATPEELESATDEEAAHLGLSVEAIDWSGLDEALRDYEAGR